MERMLNRARAEEDEADGGSARAGERAGSVQTTNARRGDQGPTPTPTQLSSPTSQPRMAALFCLGWLCLELRAKRALPLPLRLYLLSTDGDEMDDRAGVWMRESNTKAGFVEPRCDVDRASACSLALISLTAAKEEEEKESKLPGRTAPPPAPSPVIN